MNEEWMAALEQPEEYDYWDNLILPEGGVKGMLYCHYVRYRGKKFFKKQGCRRCRQRVRMNLRGHHNKSKYFIPVTAWDLS